MRRLTPKDVASRKTECVVAPDFYALSRDHPLPESSAVCPIASPPILPQPPAIAAAVAAAAAQAGQSGDQFGPILAELEMLEKRRREIVDRIAILAQTQVLGGTGVPAVPVALEASQRQETADFSTNQTGLSNSNTSGSDVAIRSILASLGHHGGADAASRSQSDGIGSLLQQAGLIALAQQPGGAQLVAQIVQANNQNMSKPIVALPSPVVQMPDSSAQNALLMLQLLQQIMRQPAPAPQAPPPAAPSNAQMLEMLMRSISAPSQQASVPLALQPSSSLPYSATAPGHGTLANAAGGQGINNATAATQQNALLQMLMQAQQQHAQAAGQISQANNATVATQQNALLQMLIQAQQQHAQAAGHMSQTNNSNNAACGSPQSELQQMQPANDDDNKNSTSATSSSLQQHNIQQKQVPQTVNSNNAAGQQQEQQPQNATQQNAFLQQMQQQMSGGNAAVVQQAAFLQMLSAAQQQAAAQQQNAPPQPFGPDANNIQRQLLEAQLLQPSGTLATFLAMGNNNNNNNNNIKNNPSRNSNNNNNGQDPKPNEGPGN
jgi:hypothetical protein